METLSIGMEAAWDPTSAADAFVFGKDRDGIDITTIEGRDLGIWMDDDSVILVEMTVVRRCDGVWLWAAKADEKTGEAHSRDAARRLAEAVAWDVAIKIVRDQIPSEVFSRFLYKVMSGVAQRG